MNRSRWKVVGWLLALGLAVGAGVGAAEEKPAPSSVGGKGKFSSKQWTFELGTAFAFPGDLSFDEGQGVIVALTNAGLEPAKLSVWVDRHWVLDNWVKDEETLIAYLEFTTAGQFKGVSWYFGSGDGCGYCSSSEIHSTVKAAGGRLQGTVKGEVKDKDTGELEYAVDVELDAPIEAEFPGKRLPAAGGEVGAAYLEFHRLLREGKNAEVRERLDAEWKEQLADADAEALQRFYSDLQEKHPDTVQVVDGFVEGDRAVLRIRGEKSWGKLRGEVRMDREGDAWRYDHAWTTVEMSSD